MDIVRIAPRERSAIREFASVMVDAFATEGIHAYALDLKRGNSRQARLRTALVELQSFTCDTDHILVARSDGRVVGGALLSRNASHPLHVGVRYAVRWLRVALPLLPAVRWRRLYRLHRATKLSRSIAGAHYTLSALVVRPDLQGRGIGSALLAEVHRVSECDPGVLGVYLYTGDSKNHLMYERAGYATIETRHADWLTVYHMFRTNGGRFEPLVADR
jgi:GNAT superfamily N-acetyltransferase